MFVLTKRRSIALVAVVALGLGACSDDDGDDAGSTGTAGSTSATGSSPVTDAGGGGSATSAAGTESTGGSGGSADGILGSVKSADSVRCGTRDALPGFAVLEASGDHVGFDADFCKVVAAAVLGDATKVEFVDLETADRFTALQSGSVDVLIRNTTWTSSRDGVEGATFLHPNFYDGQGMMVAADSGFASIEDLSSAIICVAKGTTTEGNAAAASNRLGLNWEIRTFDDTDQIQSAFVAGQCDGWSSDTSQLTGLRSAYPDGAEALTILPEVFSKEPLAPAVADGDTQWAQVVNWAILATIQAEEFGITQANVDEMLAGEDVSIKQFLGAEVTGEDGSASTLDPGLGLPVDFAYQVVKQVGNYGEIFERNLAPLGLERGVNALWTDGGLMYSPPYR
ncbi:MAG: amino acid ABC transporter substrate-binding protein [Actinomycetota bacterium]|nr:amino acid ABC transporter substrate-binding protein [Actinomycetota bacterium]